jgi:hypothetical protein
MFKNFFFTTGNSLSIVNQEPSFPSSELVAYWKMDEISGTSGNDEIGTNDLLLDVSINQTGKINKAYSFNGISSNCDFSIGPTAGKSNVSVSMWLYPRDLTSSQGIWSEENSGSYYQFTILMGSFITRDIVQGETGARDNDLALPTLNINQWNHLVFIYSVSENHKSIYLNGIKSASTNTSISQLTSTRNGVLSLGTISNPTTDEWFDGLMDEIGVWGRALSSIEILTLYNGGSGLNYSYTCASLNGGTISGSQTLTSTQDPSAFVSVALASGGYGTLTYTWQYSTTSSTAGSGSWSNIPSSNSSTYDSSILSVTTNFCRKVNDQCSTIQTAYSNVVTITVNTASSFPAAGLISYWKFDETSGNTAYNSYSSTYDGSLSNVTFTTGKINNGCLFNGTNSEITYKNQLTGGLSEVTLSMWVYPHELVSTNMLIEETTSGYWQYAISQSLWITRNVSTGTTGARTNDLALPTLTQDAWNHLVFVYSVSEGYKKIYRNAGNPSTNTTNIVQLTTSRDYPYHFFGGTISDTYFDGLMDEIGMWNRALSAAEVSILYNNGLGLSINSSTGDSSTGDGSTGFIIYDSWNFDHRDVGFYSDADVAEDFNYNFLWSHNSASIAEDTINDASTKVLKVTHEANTLSVGFEMGIDFGVDYDEIYTTFNMKFSNNFNSTHGGKFPGQMGLPRGWDNPPSGNPPSGYGFIAMNLFLWGGVILSYHYDRTTSGSPWTFPDPVGNYQFDPFYFVNNQWYEVTERMVLNTFTGGVPNADGIKELWIDGKLVIQESNLKLMQDESASMKIDGLRFASFYGGEYDSYKPIEECYTYFNNIKVFMPASPDVSGHNLHSSSTIINTPSPITNKTIVYDRLITTEGTLSNLKYGSNYDPVTDEKILIDAGAGNTVTYNMSNYGVSSYDYIFFYDGNQTNSPLITFYQGESGINQVINSTGRYLFIRLSSDQDGYEDIGFTGTVAFN